MTPSRYLVAIQIDMRTIVYIFLFLNLTSIYGQCTLSLNYYTPYCTQCDGSISAVPMGAPPFIFQWSSGSTTSNLTGLCPGIYSLTMTDANNCVATASVSLINWVSIVVNTIQPSCNNCCDGSATITATGGTPPYIYYNGCNTQTSNIITGLCTGVCSAQVNDSQNCGAGFNIEIEFQLPLGIEVTALDRGISVSPNPFSLTTKINITSDLPDFDLEIVNIYGEVVKHITNIKNRTLEFNRDQLSSGTYTLFLTKDKRFIARKKIVILD